MKVIYLQTFIVLVAFGILYKCIHLYVFVHPIFILLIDKTGERTNLLNEKVIFLKQNVFYCSFDVVHSRL